MIKVEDHFSIRLESRTEKANSRVEDNAVVTAERSGGYIVGDRLRVFNGERVGALRVAWFKCDLVGVRAEIETNRFRAAQVPMDIVIPRDPLLIADRNV